MFIITAITLLLNLGTVTLLQHGKGLILGSAGCFSMVHGDNSRLNTLSDANVIAVISIAFYNVL